MHPKYKEVHLEADGLEKEWEDLDVLHAPQEGELLLVLCDAVAAALIRHARIHPLWKQETNTVLLSSVTFIMWTHITGEKKRGGRYRNQRYWTYWLESVLSVLRILIRVTAPFWPLDPGSGMGKKNPDPESRMNIPELFPRASEKIFRLRILKFFDTDPDLFYPGSRIRDGTIRIRNKHPGSASLARVIDMQTLMVSTDMQWPRRYASGQLPALMCCRSFQGNGGFEDPSFNTG